MPDHNVLWKFRKLPPIHRHYNSFGRVVSKENKIATRNTFFLSSHVFSLDQRTFNFIKFKISWAMCGSRKLYVMIRSFSHLGSII